MRYRLKQLARGICFECRAGIMTEFLWLPIPISSPALTLRVGIPLRMWAVFLQLSAMSSCGKGTMMLWSSMKEVLRPYVKFSIHPTRRFIHFVIIWCCAIFILWKRESCSLYRILLCSAAIPLTNRPPVGRSILKHEKCRWAICVPHYGVHSLHSLSTENETNLMYGSLPKFL
jgi:hypothetical protein